MPPPQSSPPAIPQYQKFHKKPLPPPTNHLHINLNQAIKTSNVKYFIKNNLKINTQNSIIQPQNNQDLQSHLLILKKQCNDLYRSIKNKQLQSIKFKQETLNNKQKINKNHQYQLQLQQQILELQNNLSKINTKRQSAQLSSKTYQHILQRMKLDDVYHQLYKNQLKQKVTNLQKIFDITLSKHYSITKFQKQTESGLKDAYLQLSQQNYQRKNNYTSIQNQTKQKIQHLNKLKQRQKQTEFISSLAADDILDSQLIKLKKFLNIQIFIRQLLKHKINKLKKYNLFYQHTYLIIKFHTNVTNSTSLKQQFFNHENSYQDKIIWIKFLQNLINSYQQQQLKLKNQLNNTKLYKISDTQQINHDQHYQNQQFKNKLLLTSKSLQHQVIWQRIQPWILMQAKKLQLQNISNTDNITLFTSIINKIKPQQPHPISQNTHKSKSPHII